MPIVITPMTEEDIPGVIDAIQQAFAEDPYNKWIYDDRSKVRNNSCPPPPLPLLTIEPH